MKENHLKKVSDCIRCKEHIMQTSCAVVCGYFKDSYRELPLILCDDPSLDYVEECPMQLRNASDMKPGREYTPRTAAAPLLKKRCGGKLIKLFG